MINLQSNQLVVLSIIVSTSILSGFVSHSSSVICARIVDNLDEDPVLENISTEEGSWIASTFVIGEIIGYSSSYYVEGFLGPKSSLVGDMVLHILGSIILSIGSRIPVLCLGRLILGISTSLSHTSSLSLLAEVLCLQSYVVIASLLYVAKIFGSLLMALCGSLISSWRLAFSGFFLSFSSMTLIGLLLFTRESPAWLLEKNKNEVQARKSLSFYHNGDLKTIESHLSLLRSQGNIWSEEGITFVSIENFIKSFRYTFLTNNFIYLCLTFILLEWSSLTVLNYYLISILQLLEPPMSTLLSSIILQGVYFLFSVVVCLGLTLKKTPPYPLKHFYFSSGVIILAALTAIATYCSLADFVPQSSLYISNLNWIPLAMLAFILCSFSVGYDRIPQYFLYSQPEGSISLIRFVLALSSLSSFIAVKSAPSIIESLRIYGIFWIFTLVVTLNLCISFYLIPEVDEDDLEDDDIIINLRGGKGSPILTVSNTMSVLSKMKDLHFDESKNGFGSSYSERSSSKDISLQMHSKNIPITTI